MATPLAPVDPNVKLPPNIAAQVAAADQLHKDTYTQPASPQPDPTPSPAPDTAPAPSLAPQPAPPPAQPPEPQPQPQAPAQVAPQKPPKAPPPAEALSAEEWRSRYMSMEGRHRQATTSMGALQEQLSEMGDELMRSQQAIQELRGRLAPAPQAPAAPSFTAHLTPEEREAYGPGLIEVIEKVARGAVMPDLQNMQSGVQRSLGQVSQRVQQLGTLGVYQTLDEQVPDWRTINDSEEFKRWVRLPDVYSGVLREKLLKAAFSAGQSARVVAFFKGFLDEGQATGAIPDPNVQQPATPARTPTVPLEMLAAPGRAKPAGGGQDPAVPADKPHFTRAQIKSFYDGVRQGLWAGRDPEKNAMEQQIFAAQKEGRVH